MSRYPNIIATLLMISSLPLIFGFFDGGSVSSATGEAFALSVSLKNLLFYYGISLHSE